jgi:EAL domain-containing protein (putative c-di-GMP-specific phosphodiesterase class I)
MREADRQQGERALELRAILEGARLTTLYQPIVDMDQGSIMGYEALTRGPANSKLFPNTTAASVSRRLTRVATKPIPVSAP